MAKRAEQNVTGAEILIVEDDPRVLSATFDAVIELGHHPVAGDHPSKAASLLAEHERIGLIISDVLMPDMTGPEMAAMLRHSHSDIPVLFVRSEEHTSELQSPMRITYAVFLLQKKNYF